MGYSDDALERPIVGITNTYSDFNLPRDGAAARCRGQARRHAGRRTADGISDDLAARVVRLAHQHVFAQSDGAGYRGMIRLAVDASC